MGRPCLEVGDIIVMDNLSSHHYEGGEILEEWLYEMGIELIYTPSYSPDLNPVEFCFSKVEACGYNPLQNKTCHPDFVRLIPLSPDTTDTVTEMVYTVHCMFMFHKYLLSI